MSAFKSVLLILSLSYPSTSLATNYYELYEDLTGLPAPTFCETMYDIAGYTYCAATYFVSTGQNMCKILRHIEFYWPEEN